MKKNNNILGVLVVLLSIVVLGLTGFIVYDKVLNKDAKEVNNNAELENVKNDLDEIVKNELYVLWNKNSIGEITTQERLQLALERYAKDNNYDLKMYQPEKVTASELESSYNKTSVTINPLVHQNIYFYEKVGCGNAILYSYDDSTKTYTVNPSGRGVIKIEPTYSKIVSFEEKGKDSYHIAYQYLFTWINHGEVDNNVYLSYDDASKQVNGIKVFNYSGNNVFNSYDELETKLKSFVENNYDELKNKLITCNYDFDYENGKYNLKNYYLS